MLNEILLYSGSAIITIWGVAHIIPTKNVVEGFGKISDESKRFITMEWVGEGLALCFIGLLVFVVTLLEGTTNPASVLVYLGSAIMAIVLAVWTFVIGFKTSIIPIKICPIVLAMVAGLFLLGSIL